MTASTKRGLTYADVGVSQENETRALDAMLPWIERTFAHGAPLNPVKLGLGHFANVIQIGPNLGLAMSVDGVGSKVLVAQMLDRYDTVGIDCVAMNANDVICVGARPVAMLNYLAVQEADEKLLEEIGRGLYEGARLARISIPGGETAQLPELISGCVEGRGFDLAGAIVGLVALDELVVGADVEEGDVVIGIASTGVHSNGLTLARRALFDEGAYRPDTFVEGLGRTVGEELLVPTRIYVPEAMDLIGSELGVKALVNITSDGLLNLARVSAPDVGFMIEWLPEPPPIFGMIQECGAVSDEEMFLVFNLGIGFCVVVAPDDVGPALEIIGRHNVDAWQIGRAVRDPRRRVTVAPKALVGEGDSFTRAREAASMP